MSSLFFCCLLKLIYFIWIFIFRNCFIKNYISYVNASLTWLIISSFLAWSTLYKSFPKNDGFWYRKYFLNISLFILFSSFSILLIKFSCSFNEYFLVFAFVGSFVSNIFGLGVGSGADFSADSGVGILSIFFIRNKLFLNY